MGEINIDAVQETGPGNVLYLGSFLNSCLNIIL